MYNAIYVFRFKSINVELRYNVYVISSGCSKVFLFFGLLTHPSAQRLQYDKEHIQNLNWISISIHLHVFCKYGIRSDLNDYSLLPPIIVVTHLVPYSFLFSHPTHHLAHSRPAALRQYIVRQIIPISSRDIYIKWVALPNSSIFFPFHPHACTAAAKTTTSRSFSPKKLGREDQLGSALHFLTQVDSCRSMYTHRAVYRIVT